jgi:hypothetical protein
MGFYLQTGGFDFGKAQYIEKAWQGVRIPQPASFDEVPADKALICVVENPRFEAAAFAYDEHEFAGFGQPTDDRPKTWLLMDRQKAEDLTNFNSRHR